jgi:hypothetical protein
MASGAGLGSGSRAVQPATSGAPSRDTVSPDAKVGRPAAEEALRRPRRDLAGERAAIDVEVHVAAGDARRRRPRVERRASHPRLRDLPPTAGAPDGLG